MYYFKTERLSVGYNGRAVIENIDVELEKGKILTLIGPNGAGKSTILKTITRQLATISGSTYIAQQELWAWSPKELARRVAVVLTDRIKPELMTCAEVVAMGRYPYTNLLGKLTPEDVQIVQEALARVHADELAQQDFSTLSDGQRQRVMLARAICQKPEIIILDEPTAYLDIRHKIELLDILRDMAKNENITVIMSLHEIDLAMKASDYLLWVKGSAAVFGTPDEILRSNTVEGLYDMEKGKYNLLFGSVELTKPIGEPKAFIIAGGGCGIPHYRAMQKQRIPFATGILFENDVDYQVARDLAACVISAPAFEPMALEHFDRAVEVMLKCEYIIDAKAPLGSLNTLNGELLKLAKEKGMKII